MRLTKEAVLAIWRSVVDEQSPALIRGEQYSQAFTQEQWDALPLDEFIREFPFESVNERDRRAFSKRLRDAHSEVVHQKRGATNGLERKDVKSGTVSPERGAVGGAIPKGGVSMPEAPTSSWTLDELGALMLKMSAEMKADVKRMSGDITFLKNSVLSLTVDVEDLKRKTSNPGSKPPRGNLVYGEKQGISGKPSVSMRPVEGSVISTDVSCQFGSDPISTGVGQTGVSASAATQSEASGGVSGSLTSGGGNIISDGVTTTSNSTSVTSNLHSSGGAGNSQSGYQASTSQSGYQTSTSQSGYSGVNFATSNLQSGGGTDARPDAGISTVDWQLGHSSRNNPVSFQNGSSDVPSSGCLLSVTQSGYTGVNSQSIYQPRNTTSRSRGAPGFPQSGYHLPTAQSGYPSGTSQPENADGGPQFNRGQWPDWSQPPPGMQTHNTSTPFVQSSGQMSFGFPSTPGAGSQHFSRDSYEHPRFSFDGSRRTKFETFLGNYVAFAEEHGWTDLHKAKRMRYCLEGVAADFYSSLSTQDYQSWDEVKDKLQRRFGRKEHPCALRMNLIKDTQRVDETMDEYYQRFYDDLLYAYEMDETLANRHGVELFLRGLQNRCVAESMMERIQAGTLRCNLAEVFQAASDNAAWRNSFGPSSSRSRSSVELRDVKRSSVRWEDENEQTVTDDEDDWQTRSVKNESSSQLALHEFQNARKDLVNAVQEGLREGFKGFGEELKQVVRGIADNSRFSSSRFGVNGQFRSRSPSPARSPGGDDSCFNCRQKGHWARNCILPCGECGSKEHKRSGCIKASLLKTSENSA